MSVSKIVRTLSTDVDNFVLLSRPESKAEGHEALLETRVVDPYPNPSQLKLLKSVFKPGNVYRFRVTRTASMTTSGAGALLLATAVYPSQFVQYSALVNLFQEARLRATRIQLVFLATGVASALTSTFCSSFDPTNVSSAPTFAYATQQPGAKLFSLWQTANKACVNKWVCKTARPWSIISASGGGTDPMSGTSGTWYHAIAQASTISTLIGNYLIECDYEFRNPI